MRYIPKITLIICSLILLNYNIAGCGELLEEEAQKYRNEGLSAQQKGDLSKAIEYYQKAINLDPSAAPIYNDLGVVYEIQAKLGEAEDMYLRSISIEPNFLAPYFNLGILYEKRQDLPKAAYYFKKRYELGLPNDPRTKESLDHLSQISEIDPLGRSLYLQIEAAQLMRDIKKPGAGQVEAKSSQEDLSLVNIYLEKAKKLYKKKDYMHALKELNKAFVLDPRNPEVADLLQRAQLNILLNHEN